MKEVVNILLIFEIHLFFLIQIELCCFNFGVSYSIFKVLQSLESFGSPHVGGSQPPDAQAMQTNAPLSPNNPSQTASVALPLL